MLSCFNAQRTLCALIVSCLFLLPGAPTAASHPDLELKKLDRGEVVVDLKKIDGVNFVTGRILIDQPPSHVWPIMTNPFEFEGKISPRMRSVKVMVDKTDYSILKCTVHIGFFFIPSITYTVASKYDPVERIQFSRVDGDLKDFRGLWEVKPVSGGHKTELTYSMYIDPGFPVPQWMIREGVKMELPRTLIALRNRVKAIYTDNVAPDSRTIMASNTLARTSWLPELSTSR